MPCQPEPRSRVRLRFIYALACFISIRTLRLCASRRIPTGLMQRPARGSSRAFSFNLRAAFLTRGDSISESPQL